MCCALGGSEAEQQTLVIPIKAHILHNVLLNAAFLPPFSMFIYIFRQAGRDGNFPECRRYYFIKTEGRAFR